MSVNLKKIQPTVKVLLFIVMLFSCITVNAQTSDDIYTEARKEAFENKNYKKAIDLSQKALELSPDYTELNIFLGRLYTWDKQPEQARLVFEKVMIKNPDNTDLYLAYGSLEYWNKNYEKALELTDKGLGKSPQSEELLLLKARILKDSRQYTEANSTLTTLLEINPKNNEARTLSQVIGMTGFKNAVGVYYDYYYFDKRFDDPWHIASVDYTRQGNFGTLTGRVNYANKFAMDAMQFEIESYPRISDVFYTYVNAGISDDKGIFPEYKAGFSLFANLPKGFEAEGGFRMLSFSGEQTWTYTLSAGKYYKNLWFNLRGYFTPDRNNVGQSYQLTTRYYLGGADEYLSLRLGTGISPDNQNNVLLNETFTYKLKSYNVALEYRTVFNRSYVVYARTSIENQEYAPNTKGNQITAGVGAIKRF
ncbi:TPR repeat-containing protein [Flavobacterium beibuense]|uniref:TPR repeat-containing protein n=2 Tax=Flavobacterium beibuense TaxID=657326 RepID=A0A444W3F1_9FLAO|nr:TPR repeat-containing protein [Flavobacterium beibuense]